MSITKFDQKISEEVAQILLDVEAIKLQPESPFTWASGWKSPIYCDNRISLSFPEARDKIKRFLAQAIKEKYPNAQAIAGVATAGIPQGALVADTLGLPFIYVRSKPKGHGLTNQIEGKVVKGQKVVVIEDLISTGGSSLAAVGAMKAVGLAVEGMVAIFSYAFQVATDNFEKAGVDLTILSDYPSLLSISKFDGSTLEILNNWRKAPDSWGK
jgi:orotate phosphoribosyltransferase